MKSKQIAKNAIIKLTEKPTEELINSAISDICKVFIEDFHHLRKARNIKFDSALVPLFKEMDQKWNTVRALLFQHYNIHLIVSNGFRTLLKRMNLRAYEFYMKSLK